MPRARGRFIVLDGPDGAGKTTQLRLLAEELERRGRDVLCAREPGGTELGEKVRNILLDPANHAVSERTELFLFMACRAHLVDQVILPALEQGKVVLCDRFLPSTIVYQGYAGSQGTEIVETIGEFCIQACKPDLTLLIDVDIETSELRRKKQKDDRIEQRDRLYHEKVREGFLELARRHPGEYRVLDGRQPIGQLQQEILRLVEEVL